MRAFDAHRKCNALKNGHESCKLFPTQSVLFYVALLTASSFSLMHHSSSSRFRSTDREFWYEEARSALRRRLQQNPPSAGTKAHARNVILFVGDGMSLTTITAARILRGQRLGRLGEEHELAWDKFPAVALVKVCRPVHGIAVTLSPGTLLTQVFSFFRRSTRMLRSVNLQLVPRL